MLLRRMSRAQGLRFGPALIGAFLIAGCQTTGDVGRTWEYGQHRVPQSSLRDGQYYALTEIRKNPETWRLQVAEAKLKPGIKLPAVIYLHGCAGNTVGDAWGAKFGELGYAFFAPNSLSRPRKSLCYTGQMTSYRIPMRMEELHYALEQVRKIDWIDQNRIVLMGSSEGAQAASRYGGRDFAAVILTGTDCRFSGGSPNTPRDIPVLSMVGSKDDKGGGSGCSISRTVGGSKRVVIQGAFHKLAREPEARRVLEQFLEECCAKPG